MHLLSKIKSLPKRTLILIVFLLLALVTTVVLLQQRQDLRQRALTPYPSPTVATQFGQAVYLNGSSYLEYTNYWQAKQPFQIEAWIKPEYDQSTVNKKSYTIFSQGPDTINPQCGDSFMVNLNNHSDHFTVGLDHWKTNEGGSGGMNVSLVGKYNTWNHIAVTVDASNVITLFVNGKKAYGTQFKSPVCTSAKQILVGAYQPPYAESAPIEFFKGAIDEIRISKINRNKGDIYPLLMKPFQIDSSTLEIFNFNGNINGKVTKGFSAKGKITYVQSNIGQSIPTSNPKPSLSISPPITRTQSPTPTPATVSCDTDGNNVLNIRDFMDYYYCAKKTPQCTPDVQKRADLNKNGRIDSNDLSIFYNRCVVTTPTRAMSQTPTRVPSPSISVLPTRVVPPSTYPTGPTPSGIRTTTEISGQVFIDYDKNKYFTIGNSQIKTDKAFANATVYLRQGNTYLRKTTSDTNGFFRFFDLKPNVAYTIQLAIPYGYTTTTPAVISVTPTLGKVIEQRFGIYPQANNQ